jgi:CubicO group peptidase (beta-lactamase class C family)
VACALASASSVRAAAPPDSAALGRTLDACVASLVRGGELSGQLIVARNGAVLVERSWGAADREHHRPMTPTTRMCIASITKPVNQAVALRLAKEGRFAFSDTIGRFLPGYPHGRVTIDQLMNHRAGIPHRVTTADDEQHAMSPADVTERAGRTPLLFEPGSRSLYSSAGYTVLARVLELASGRSWGDLVREYVIGPAKLEHTVPTAGLAEPLPERATSYVPGANGIIAAPTKDLTFLAGAGSMWSTARDLLQLSRALLDGTLGKDARANLVRRGNLRWSGSTDGFFSYLDHDSLSGVTSVFLGNMHDGAPALLREVLPKLAAGEAVAPLEKPNPRLVKVPEERLRRFEGRYDVASNLGLPFEVREGVLWANDWPLWPTSDTSFFSPRDYGIVTQARDSTGAVTGFMWSIGGNPYPCPRTGDLAKSGAGR